MITIDEIPQVVKSELCTRKIAEPKTRFCAERGFADIFRIQVIGRILQLLPSNEMSVFTGCRENVAAQKHAGDDRLEGKLKRIIVDPK